MPLPDKPEVRTPRRTTVTKQFARKLFTFAMVGAFAGAFPALASAVESTTPSVTDSATTNIATEPDVALIRKYAEVFSGWAGSTDNALALLNGLHDAKAITLTQPATKTTSGSTTVSRMNVSIGIVTSSSTGITADIATTFTAPTQPMSVRDAGIALAIAQKELSLLRIASPTPVQIHAVLDGGSVSVAGGTRRAAATPGAPSKTAASKATLLQGILTLRAKGMAWGNVAHRSGVDLAPVMAGLKRSSASVRTVSTDPLDESRSIFSAPAGSPAQTTTGATFARAE
jgi:hypothetical protein